MNPINLRKYLPGFFIFASVAGIAHFFLKFSLTWLELGILSTGVYVTVALIAKYRHRALQAFAVVMLLVLSIVVIDFAVTSYSKINQVNMVVEEVGAEVPIAQKAHKRHDVQWLHQMRDWMDEEAIIKYMDWIINERIEKALVNGEDIQVNAPFEKVFAGSFFLVLAMGMVSIYNTKMLKPLLMAPLVVFIIAWYQFIDFHWMLHAFYFGGLLAYWIIDRQDTFKAKYNDHNQRHYSSNKMVIWSVILALLFLAGSNVAFWLTPYKGINKIADAVVPNIWGARSGYDTQGLRMYSLKDTTLQFEEDRLGGPAGPIDEETPLFWLELENAPTNQLYLKSVIRETYDGTKWLNGTQVYRNSFQFYNENPEHQRLLSSPDHPKIKGNIQLDQLKTITLFAPMGLYKTSLDEQRVYASQENEAFFKAGAFVKFLKAYDFEATGREFNIDPEVDYLQVSSWVEERTKTLSLRIGKLGDTPYDQMNILTQFLTQNYKYELVTKTPRKTKDFVGAFLFDDKEGYCTYFASALTIMARINGIPARYVEGFLVTDPVANTPLKVTEAQAHAWTEAYIEGYGWVIFEATPPFNNEAETVENFTLDEVLNEEQTETIENVATQIADQSQDPFENEEFLMESTGGLEDVEVDLTEAPSNRLGLKAIGYSLLLILFGGVLYIFYRPVYHLRDLPTPTYVTRNLQWLCILIKANTKSPIFDPEKQLKAAQIPEDLANLWLRFLYGPKREYEKEELVQLQNQLDRYIKIQRGMYWNRTGRISYLKMRFITIRRMVP